MGVMGPNICQGTLHPVIIRPTSVWPMEPRETSKLAPAPLSSILGKSDEGWFGQIPMEKGDLVKAQPSQGESPALYCNKIKYRFGVWMHERG